MGARLDADFYSVLGIRPEAPKHEVREAYRRLALLHHPDKNPGDARACSAFQKLGEAYDTLYDESRRILYDARYKATRPGFQRTAAAAPNAKEAETVARERLRREKEEREWAEKECLAAEHITRLKKVIEIIAAAISAWDRLERERLAKENQKQGWWPYIASWGTAATPVETTEQKMLRRQEEIRQQADRSRKLNQARSDLKQREDERAELLLKHRQAKEREAREREQRERAAHAREASERAARQQADVQAREAQRQAAEEKKRKTSEAEAKIAVQKKAARDAEKHEAELREALRQRLAKTQARADAENARSNLNAFLFPTPKAPTPGPVPTRPQTARDAEKREAELREALRQKLAKSQARVDAEKAYANAFPALPKATPAPVPSRARRAQFDPQSRRGPAVSGGPKGNYARRKDSRDTPSPDELCYAHTPATCAHERFWSRVEGRQRCGVCARMLPLFVLLCPGCGVRACGSCRGALKRGG